MHATREWVAKGKDVVKMQATLLPCAQWFSGENPIDDKEGSSLSVPGDQSF